MVVVLRAVVVVGGGRTGGRDRGSGCCRGVRVRKKAGRCVQAVACERPGNRARAHARPHPPRRSALRLRERGARRGRNRHRRYRGCRYERQQREKREPRAGIPHGDLSPENAAIARYTVVASTSMAYCMHPSRGEGPSNTPRPPSSHPHPLCGASASGLSLSSRLGRFFPGLTQVRVLAAVRSPSGARGRRGGGPAGSVAGVPGGLGARAASIATLASPAGRQALCRGADRGGRRPSGPCCSTRANGLGLSAARGWLARGGAARGSAAETARRSARGAAAAAAGAPLTRGSRASRPPPQSTSNHEERRGRGCGSVHPQEVVGGDGAGSVGGCRPYGVTGQTLNG